MEVAVLSRQQIQGVYEDDLVYSFPRSERKPLAMIFRSMDKGIYECFGMMDGSRVLAYAFFVKVGSSYLLDYLATVQGHRGKGLGSEFLSLLGQRFSGSGCMIAEIEDPAAADGPEELELRNRRKRFYLRNGFWDTDVLFYTFGVVYRLLELPMERSHSKEEIVSAYWDIYRTILPPEMYEKNIKRI